MILLYLEIIRGASEEREGGGKRHRDDQTKIKIAKLGEGGFLFRGSQLQLKGGGEPYPIELFCICRLFSLWKLRNR